MNIYEAKNIGARIAGNPYVGRGIVIGKTADGTKVAVAYFIMGRSANSRNRVFRLKDGALYTEPFDLSRVEDPVLDYLCGGAHRTEPVDRDKRRSD